MSGGGLSQFPARNTAFQNKDGEISGVWYMHLLTQWQKTGGGSSTATVTSAVQKAGDSMTGPLVLSGAPTLAGQAANKAYVDASTGAIAGKVNKSGDTMTGALTLFGPPTVPLHAADKAYVDAGDGTNATAITAEASRASTAEGVNASAITAETSRATTAEGLLAPKASPTLTGVPLAPTAAPGTNTTQLATTAFDTAAVAVETSRATIAEALLAPKASPSFTGNALVAGGVGVWGHAAPGAQPAAPVTLADVIAIIRGCGLSA